MIHLFPAEILEQINNCLSWSDYVQLMLIGRTYHVKYVPMVYREIVISTDKELKLFTKAYRYFKHVRSLDLFDASLEPHYVEGLPVLFPFLESLVLSISLCSAGKTYGLIQPFPYLTTLTLEVKSRDRWISKVLATMPYLKALYVLGLDHVRHTVQLLDSLHEACPLLEILYLQGDTHMILPTDEASIPKVLYSRIRAFVLEFIGIGPYQHWLRYIANRYPNIQFLKLRAFAGCLDEVGDCSEEFYDWFWLSCPRLTEYHWVNIIPEEGFVKRLSYEQRQLQMIKIFWDRVIVNYMLEQDPTRSQYLSAILNLDLDIPARMNYREFIVSISRLFPRLQVLKLQERDRSTDETMCISTVIDLFPCLHHLEFNKITFSDPPFSRPQVQALSLTTVCFNDCVYSDDMLDHIALCCPQLKEMTSDGINLLSQ